MKLAEATGCPRSSPAEGKGRPWPGSSRPPHPGSTDDRPDAPARAPPAPAEEGVGTGSPRDAGGPPPSALGRGDRPPGLRALGRSLSALQSVAVVPVRDKGGGGVVSGLPSPCPSPGAATLGREERKKLGRKERSSRPCWTGAVEFVLRRHKQKLKKLLDSARAQSPPLPRGQNGAERRPEAPATQSKTGSGLFLSGPGPALVVADLMPSVPDLCPAESHTCTWHLCAPNTPPRASQERQRTASLPVSAFPVPDNLSWGQDAEV